MLNARLHRHSLPLSQVARVIMRSEQRRLFPFLEQVNEIQIAIF